MRKWRIYDWGDVPSDRPYWLDFTCLGCGNDALLPVLGAPLAQTGMGIVFDLGRRAMPKDIRCPHCRRRYYDPRSLEREDT